MSEDVPSYGHGQADGAPELVRSLSDAVASLPLQQRSAVISVVAFAAEAGLTIDELREVVAPILPRDGHSQLSRGVRRLLGRYRLAIGRKGPGYV